MDHSVTGGRDMSDSMTREELAAYHEDQARQAAELNATITPEARAIAERLGVLFERVAFGGRK